MEPIRRVHSPTRRDPLPFEARSRKGDPPMTPLFLPTSRRGFLRTAGLTLGAAAFTTPGLFAEELTRTPRQTEGPFYPNKLPLDTDNDLIIVNDRTTPASVEITHLSGRILDSRGAPLRNALVEIWQVDANGV